MVVQLALSLGVTVGALLLQAARLGGGELTPGRFVLPFIAVGVIALAGVPFFLRLAPETGADMRGCDPGPLRCNCE